MRHLLSERPETWAYWVLGLTVSVATCGSPVLPVIHLQIHHVFMSVYAMHHAHTYSPISLTVLEQVEDDCDLSPKILQLRLL